MSDQCSICGQYLWRSMGRPHKCPPAWWCWVSDPDYGMERDDGMVVYGVNPDGAAEEFMQRWDVGGDYVCIGGDEMQVSVVPMSDLDAVQVFVVRGEMVPEYYATQN